METRSRYHKRLNLQAWLRENPIIMGMIILMSLLAMIIA